MRYRGFSIRATGKSYLGEIPLPGQAAVYRLMGKTLAELHDKIDTWIFERAMGLLAA